MRIAFYAPLKAPSHPVPSGDRFIARALIAALERGGHQVTVVSTFRSRESAGDPVRQGRIERVGGRLAARLLRRYRRMPMEERPEVWFTYHLYHKAPDFLGPALCEALQLPYFVAEASHAPKQAHGLWAGWHARCADDIRRAAGVIVINSDDRPCLQALLGGGDRLHSLPLFLDEPGFASARREREASALRFGLDNAKPWVLSVGMMRPGRKVDCYRLLAQSFRSLPEGCAEWVIVGDGEARREVNEFVRDLPFAHSLGRLPRNTLAELYAACDLFAWPAIGEPLGLVFVEAQAAGLPVVAGRTRGVPDLVRDGTTGMLVEIGSAEPFARAIASLLDDERRRLEMGRAARRYVAQQHSMEAAVARLTEIVGGR